MAIILLFVNVMLSYRETYQEITITVTVKVLAEFSVLLLRKQQHTVSVFPSRSVSMFTAAL